MDADLFLRTVTYDVLDPKEHGDISGVRRQLIVLEPVIKQLEADHGGQIFSRLLDSEHGRQVASLLLGVRSSELKSQKGRETLLPILEHWREWMQGESVRGVITGLLLAEAHTSRNVRRRQKFESIVHKAIAEAITQIRGSALSIRSRDRLFGLRNFDLVIYENLVPVIAVASVFQIGTGGRQGDVIREMFWLQEQLARNDTSLLVIADGPGFESMPALVREVIPRLRHVTNLEGIKRGELYDLISQAVAHRQIMLSARSEERAANVLRRIADEAISQGQAITPDVLDLNVDAAAAFMIRYKAEHPEYSLAQVDGKVAWVGETAPVVKGVRDAFVSLRAGGASKTDAATIGESVTKHLGLRISAGQLVPGGVMYLLQGVDYPIKLPSPLPMLIALESNPLDKNDCISSLEHALAKSDVPGRVVIVLDSFQPEVSRNLAARFSITQRIHFAVLDENDIVKLLLLRQSSARDALREYILRLTDLTLVSPYVSDGPTSENMFYGRGKELRLISSAIKERSFALMGGRKTGKTSLLHRLNPVIKSEYQVLSIDCEAHTSREAFLDYLRLQSKGLNDLQGRLLVPHAERVLRAYLDTQTRGEFTVLLVDEVDDLFIADARADEHAHVLSRSFRALTQEHRVSIVATGERKLFELTRDPSSPHWNFCTPVRVGPLEEIDARQLVQESLRALGIEFDSGTIDLALAGTAAHPNLLQYLGGLIVDRLATASRAGDKLRVTASDIEGLCNTPQFRDRFNRTFWSNSNTLEKLISTELNFSQGQSLESLWGRLGPACKKVSVSDVEDALAYLELYSIAQATSDGYKFTRAAFERYLSVIPASLRAQWRSELLEDSV